MINNAIARHRELFKSDCGSSKLKTNLKAARRSARYKSTPQEKRAACDGKRPKSREETPKEGSDNARRYRTASICNRDAQNASLFVTFSMRFAHV
jgi:hypothetical protein